MTLRWFRVRRRDLACAELVEMVTDYMGGALPDAERRRLESHLTACPHCTHYVAQLRDVLAVAGRLRASDIDALGATARTELLDAFRAYHDEG
jgi:anti-sigma factor RsiW